MTESTNKHADRSMAKSDRQPSWTRRLARQAVENAIKGASTTAGTACISLIVWWIKHR
ncbi:hypothetical protein GCM10009759_79430 [Kitasatospora saccharophila]|uniref:Uncharacterized protein n=1 Tax=Kitasatospora saccharophila TaxID=407973 RepID=A0ABN2YGN5_9ACTN